MPNPYDALTTAKYGFTSLPADQAKTQTSNQNPKAVDVGSIRIPDTVLARKALKYATQALSDEAIRHSLRVFSYGCAISRECYPDWNVTPGSALEETWFLTAILHDIGTSEENLVRTKLSYEFWAGIKALELLQEGPDGAPREQAESVCEAILRHQDVQDKGSVTLVTRLIHLGTLLDNIGAGKEMVHQQTIESVNARYDRKGWSGCFEAVVRREKELKPYAMVSRIEGFEDAIKGNEATATEEG